VQAARAVLGACLPALAPAQVGLRARSGVLAAAGIARHASPVRRSLTLLAEAWDDWHTHWPGPARPAVISTRSPRRTHCSCFV